MNKTLFLLLSMFMVLQCAAGDFSYKYEGVELAYTVLDEEAKTCMTKENVAYNPKENSFYSDVVIPSVAIDNNGVKYTVTKIGSSSFSGCKMTSVIIPNSVITIGSGAFENCRSLSTVIIGNSVTTIGFLAFNRCSYLKTLVIPPSVTTIDDRAFQFCQAEKTACPSGLKHPFTEGLIIEYPREGAIAEDGFVYGPDKKALYFVPLFVTGNFSIPDSVAEIGDFAFAQCSRLESVTIPSSVTTIGMSAFSGCTGFTEVKIPDSVTSIGYSAFINCENITSLTLGNSVVTIGENAFFKCVLIQSVDIPDSVTTIGRHAFSYCRMKSLTIGNSVETIEQYAFWQCINLNKVSIPPSVTTIGYNAFDHCTSLRTFIVEDSENNPLEFKKDALYFAPITDLYMGRNWICESEESISTGIHRIEIGNSVTIIPKYAFAKCKNIESVVIPNSVTTIGSYAFSYCNNLTSIILGNSVTNVFSNAFLNSGVEKAAYPSGLNNPFPYVSPASALSIKYPRNDSLMEDDIIYSLDKNTIYFAPCSLKDKYTIPDFVTTIAPLAFAKCNLLTSVEIPLSVTTIGHDAFFACSQLSSVTIPNSVATIDDCAFYKCNNIKSIHYNAINPITASTNVFTNYSSHLYAHVLAKEKIASTFPWCEFSKVYFIYSGVEDISIDDDAAPARYYNLQGVEIQKPENGVFIRVADGKSTKVAIR